MTGGFRGERIGFDELGRAQAGLAYQLIVGGGLQKLERMT
jgi:hypothetical protein